MPVAAGIAYVVVDLGGVVCRFDPAARRLGWQAEVFRNVGGLERSLEAVGLLAP